jgi:hypothetical protein
LHEVATEFGDAALLSEHCADDLAIRARYGVYRAICIDGQEGGWGYEAPRDGHRKAIRKLMRRGSATGATIHAGRQLPWEASNSHRDEGRGIARWMKRI